MAAHAVNGSAAAAHVDGKGIQIPLEEFDPATDEMGIVYDASTNPLDSW